MNKKVEYYNSIDGLRSFSAIGIVFMHVLENSEYVVATPIHTFIEPLKWLVFLFMMISAFSMCCGYYEKVISGSISIVTFYKKRYQKIFPFFAILVLFDLIVSFSINSLIEAFADLTLTFSLLPNSKISVIGVGWFIGIVFLFYMIFPFFCFILENKRRAWLGLLIAIIYHIVCVYYFFTPDFVDKDFIKHSNILYCSMFFMAGGIIFLYREKLQVFCNQHHKIILMISVVMTALYIIRPFFLKNIVVYNIWMLITFSSWLIISIEKETIYLSNKFVHFISGISFEIYLSHMFIFRIFDKLQIIYIFGKGPFSYVFISIAVILGSILFSVCVKKILLLLSVNDRKLVNT